MMHIMSFFLILVKLLFISLRKSKVQKTLKLIMKLRNLLFLTILAVAVSACGNRGAKEGEKSSEQNIETINNMDTTLAFQPNSLPEEPIFEIVTSEGVITVLLYKNTPLHRDNFIKLASTKFYDDILFHRVIRGFMIQVGDPLTKDPANRDRFGTGGPDYTIPAEFVAENRHKKGALAAARRGDAANPKKESSGSQFYIVQDERGCSHLDGEYTVFGETIDGFEVIDKIASAQTDYMDRPVNDIKIITIKPVL